MVPERTGKAQLDCIIFTVSSAWYEFLNVIGLNFLNFHKSEIPSRIGVCSCPGKQISSSLTIVPGFLGVERTMNGKFWCWRAYKCNYSSQEGATADGPETEVAGCSKMPRRCPTVIIPSWKQQNIRKKVSWAHLKSIWRKWVCRMCQENWLPG